MKKITKINISILAAFVLFVSVCLIAGKSASANVFIFPPSVQTSSVSTSSYAVIGIGLGTSTLTYDTYATGQTFATEGATVLVIDAATTSAAVLKMQVQYSQGGADWYNDNINVLSTTTSSFPVNLSVANSYQFQPTGSSTNFFAFPIQTPTRFVRVVFSSTGATSSVFARIIPKRQQAQ